MMTLTLERNVTFRCGIELRSERPLRTRYRRADSMGMPAPLPTYYSLSEVLALPDTGERYELVYGELLVSPSPTWRHQRVAGRLFRILAEYCERTGAGSAFYSPADLSWGRDDVLTQPDVFVVAPEDAGLGNWSAVRHVALAAEVASPSTIRNDRFGKRKVYQDMRVGLYWVIDPDARTVDVWTPDAHFPAIERERLTWHPVQATFPLVIDLGELFAE